MHLNLKATLEFLTTSSAVEQVGPRCVCIMHTNENAHILAAVLTLLCLLCANKGEPKEDCKLATMDANTAR